MGHRGQPGRTPADAPGEVDAHNEAAELDAVVATIAVAVAVVVARAAGV